MQTQETMSAETLCICVPSIKKKFQDFYMYIYIFEAILYKSRFLQPFIASLITQIGLTTVKLTCPSNTLRTSNAFARGDTGVLIDSEPHPSCRLFAPLAVRVQAGCSAFPFYTLTQPLIRLYFKCKTVLILKSMLFFLYFR